MVICEQCGKSISEEANFCSSCGETIRKPKKMQEYKVQEKQVEEQVTEITDDEKEEDFKIAPNTQSAEQSEGSDHEIQSHGTKNCNISGIEVMGQPKDSNIILRNVYCPYCNTNSALLISEITSSQVGLRMPAYGLKYFLSLIYLGPLIIFTKGFKTIEAIRNINHITYSFCPNCGNSYSANAPGVVKDEIKEPTFYKNTDEKVVMGLCKGISEYTGISLLWVRILTVLFGFAIIPAIAYVVIALCVPDKGSSSVINKKIVKVVLIVIAASAAIGLVGWGIGEIASNRGNNTSSYHNQIDVEEKYEIG